MNTGYLGDTTPKLGFGLMRLPMIGDEIDMEQVKAMVDTFMAKGFTYFDTAYVYINGKSEVAAREAIVKRYPRDSFTLATKLPLWHNIEPTCSAFSMNLWNAQVSSISITTCCTPWTKRSSRKPTASARGTSFSR